MNVVLPNGKMISLQATILLPEPKELPPEARTANVFTQLTEGSLTSIGQYCDYGCTATFDEDHVYTHYNNRLILKGNRNHSNKLWYFNLNSKTLVQLHTTDKGKRHHLLANYIDPKTNAKKLTRFLHGACGSPCVQTMTYSVKQNHLATWPHINTTNIREHIRAPTPTILGHLDHQRKNKSSTKKPLTALETQLDIKPSPTANRCNKVCINIYEERGRIYTD